MLHKAILLTMKMNRINGFIIGDENTVSEVEKYSQFKQHGMHNEIYHPLEIQFLILFDPGMPISWKNFWKISSMIKP